MYFFANRLVFTAKYNNVVRTITDALPNILALVAIVALFYWLLIYYFSIPVVYRNCVTGKVIAVETEAGKIRHPKKSQIPEKYVNVCSG
jgi:hypothetical protein